MSANPGVRLPPLPDPARLADLCREAAARERFEAAGIEKDFFLTRVLWAFGQFFGDTLLLKGGTLLSKVDLGFRRLSEDIDWVIPGAPSRTKRDNAVQLNRVRDALRTLAPAIGVEVPHAHGERSEKDAHCHWEARYPSEFGPQGVRIEVSIRPVHLRPRRVGVSQLLAAVELGSYADAQCWALDATESRAEKVRAATTREAIRDFYDLDRLLASGANFSDKGFLAVVDAKLQELGAGPIKAQKAVFALTPERLRDLEASLARELPSVVRVDEAPFELGGMVKRFATLWGQSTNGLALSGE